MPRQLRDETWTFDELFTYAEGLQRRLAVLEASEHVTDPHYRISDDVVEAWGYLYAQLSLDRFDDICQALHDAGYRFRPQQVGDAIDRDVLEDGENLVRWLYEDSDELIRLLLQSFAAEEGY